MYKVVAYQVASTINIKESKSSIDWQLKFSDSDELYYKITEDTFIYIFQYGMVSFFNMFEEAIKQIFITIKPYCNPYQIEKLRLKI
jgi:uncharacterized Rmd1/YagE family protein